MNMFAVLILLIGFQAQALTLNCEAWSRRSGETTLTRRPMPFTGIQAGTNDRMYRAELHGYKYRVDWSKTLDTLYASVHLGGHSHVFATMRVPDLAVHNDAFLDFTSATNDRVSISCNVEESD